MLGTRLKRKAQSIVGHLDSLREFRVQVIVVEFVSHVSQVRLFRANPFNRFQSLIQAKMCGMGLVSQRIDDENPHPFQRAQL